MVFCKASPTSRYPISSTLCTFSFKTRAQAFPSIMAVELPGPTAMPKLISTHSFVLRGIFSVTSLPLSRSLGVGSERRTYQNIAAAQLNNGPTSYQTQLQTINEDNVEALLTFSTTTTMFLRLTTGEE
ncbi:hypothetical protein BDV95DRAFT_320393 [Massariosphaeria phaeospora]|uniref:Uncharacterized protein n=1 Tax=Massariosphaeria phaeospora TaxID=100035 RepID=A0A7C8I9I1_9PLEO|nr:hypothetical protein BDV95DRAFT_320393 [Massariosphaeria phaeospora]